MLCPTVLAGRCDEVPCQPESAVTCYRSSTMRTLCIAVASLFALTLLAGLAPVQAGGAPEAKEMQAVLSKALDFLKSQQTAEGAFAPKVAGPGVTAIVVAGLLRN